MSKLALFGGTPVCDSPPTVPWPEHTEREKALLLEALEARGWGGFPEPMPLAGRFAEAFSARHDAKYGICAVNGSVTLEIALSALQVEAGAEVIVPAYTWVATGAAPIHINAVPVMVDIDPDTYCIDPAAVEAAITHKTAAIIPVHLGASIADLDRLTEIANKHGLKLIEDCAHMHGARWREKGVGSWGDIGSFSFQTTKLMTSGEGGIVITSDDDLAQRCHSVVNCGRKEPGYDSFDGWHLGINGRITEFQAAILIAQLERLDDHTKTRAETAAKLEGELERLGFSPLARDERTSTRGAYQLVLRYDKEAFEGVTRDRFLEALSAEGIEFDGDFYVPMFHNPIFDAKSKNWPMLRERYGDGIRAEDTLAKLSTPVTSKAAYEEAVWIHHPYLMAGDAAVSRIVEAVEKVRGQLDALKA